MNMQTERVEHTGWLRSCILITCTCFSFYVSGGNERKLSTAVALVGDPSVVFLVRFSYFTWPILTNKT